MNRLRLFRGYCYMVLVFSALLSLVYVLIGGYSAMCYVFPNVTTIESFSYDYVRSGRYMLGTEETDQFLFAVDEDTFEAKKQFLFNVAQASEKHEHSRRALRCVAFLTLYVVVFIMHLNILNRIGSRRR